MEDFNQGLQQAIQAHDPQLVEYLKNRDLVRPQIEYTPFEVVPTSASDAAVATVVAVAKPLAALSVVGVVAASVFAVGVSVVGAVTAFVAANAMYIGGGVFAATAVWLSVSALFRGKESEPQPNGGQPPKGEGWEFYQKQEQGWRKV